MNHQLLPAMTHFIEDPAHKFTLADLIQLTEDGVEQYLQSGGRSA